MIATTLTYPKEKTSVTTIKGQIPSLDGFRAISILLVIFSHLLLVQTLPLVLKNLLSFFPSGETGVRVFFTISGFLITYLLLKEKDKNGSIDLKAFYIRRVLRIFPVFLFYVFVVAVLNSSLVLGIPSLVFLSSVFYIQNFAPWGSNWLLAHSWSLSVEEQFYVLWPAIFRNVKILKSWLVPAVVMLAGALMRCVDYKYPQYSKFVLAPFFMHADFIFSGCFLAYLFFFHLEAVKRFMNNLNPVFVYIAILLTWVFAKLEFHPDYDKLFIPTSGIVMNISISFLLSYFICKKQSLGYTFLNNRIISWIGRLSYSLYIWQELFLVPSYNIYSHYWWTKFPQNLIFVFIAAFLSFQFIEKPFLKLKKRFKV